MKQLNDSYNIRSVKSFKQGNLDSLCGVYALTNATRYLANLSHHKSIQLFNEILSFLDNQDILVNTIQNGIFINYVSAILKNLICVQYPIERKKPFHRSPNTDIDQFWQFSQEFLTQNNGIIMIGMGGVHDHWSLIKAMTPKTAYLHDSSGLIRISKHNCSTHDGGEKPHTIYPTQAYFLSMKEAK